MNKTKNNIITLVILLIFLILIYIHYKKDNFIEKFVVDDHKNLKELLAIKMNISSRRITNLNIDGKLNEDSIKIKFDLLPRNTIEINEPSNTQVVKKITNLVKDGRMNINIDNEETPIKDITITKNTNELEKFSDSETASSGEYINSTINKHIEYLKTKKNPYVYNNKLDRYWKFNKNMELELPPPIPDEEDLESLNSLPEEESLIEQ